MGGYQCGLASMVHKFFQNREIRTDSENQRKAGELCKPIIKNFDKPQINLSFKDNIWNTHLPDMQLTSK